MKRLSLILICVLTLLQGCCNKPSEPEQKNYDRVAMVVSVGRNSLASYLVEDITDMCSLSAGAWLPQKSDNKAMLVVAHTSGKTSGGGYSYNVPTEIYVIQLYDNGQGVAVRDTLTSISSDKFLTEAATLREALSYVKEKFPSEHYGMLYSSHASGWLPENYLNNHNSLLSVGQERQGSESYEMDIKDVAAGLPMHLDYMLFDACLMGNVESVYEMRDCADLLAVSPTEIMGGGFNYRKLVEHLLKGTEPEVKEVCQEYYDMYAAGTGATISLISTSGLDALAQVCKPIFEKYGEAIRTASPSKVQKLYRNHPWFFDMMHLLEVAGVDAESIDSVWEALDDCVAYTAHSSQFLGWSLDHWCGLGMFAPASDSDLWDYYKSLGWNTATGLLK